MAAADTNVLVRLLVDDDEKRCRAARAFQRAHSPLFVSHLVLMETSWVLSSAYELSRQRLLEVLEMLVDTEGITIERPNIVTSALHLFRASHADFSDCLILAVAQSTATTPLATFDRKLSKLPGTKRIGRK